MIEDREFDIIAYGLIIMMFIFWLIGCSKPTVKSNDENLCSMGFNCTIDSINVYKVTDSTVEARSINGNE